MATTNKHWIFLESLRQSGETNMYGAAPYLMREFGMSRDEANTVLTDWMTNYNPADYEDQQADETQPTAEEIWENTLRSVTLTNEQWNTLTCYILMTTQHRKGEREAWEALSKELKDDGTPRFEHAASNAQYYAELDAELEKIKEIIDQY